MVSFFASSANLLLNSSGRRRSPDCFVEFLEDGRQFSIEFSGDALETALVCKGALIE